MNNARWENMMNEIDRILRQMSQAQVGEAWHGPSLMEILDGVSARVAAAKPFSHAHSIWEIVLHLTATQGLLLDRLQGIATELAPEEDWPRVPLPTEASWRETVEKLNHGEERLRGKVAAFPEERLNEPLVPNGSSAYNNFHGHVQHNLYHAGQLMLLKRIITAS
jgi:uncharacterized damage-inducible protein DinB